MSGLPPLPELRFAEIPATSRHRYVGDRFCYMETGRVDLPPVLLHGIGANSMYWRFQFAPFAERPRADLGGASGRLDTLLHQYGGHRLTGIRRLYPDVFKLFNSADGCSDHNLAHCTIGRSAAARRRP